MQTVRFNRDSYKQIIALSPIASRLMFYIICRMDTTNTIELSKADKEEFITDMQTCGKRISQQSVHNTIGELKKSGLLTERSRGVYAIDRNAFSKLSGATGSAPINAAA